VKAPVLVSAALGDAPHLPGTFALAAAGAAACGADFVKVGLMGSAREDQALLLLTAIREAVSDVNPKTRVVAAAYADAREEGGLPPEALPRVARQAGVPVVMLDTARKDGRSTFDVLGETAVRAFLESARERGLQAALAGSLGPEELALGHSMGADILGVRGSACAGGREGRLAVDRIQALREALRESVSRASVRS